MICLLSIIEIAILKLVSMVVQTGSSLTSLETQTAVFPHDGAHV